MEFNLTIIVPVLNEENSLPFFLHDLNCIINDVAEICQVLFIDNGSTDNSVAIIEQYVGKVKLPEIEMRLLNESRRGKGFAVRTGINNSIGSHLVIIDADNEYNLFDLQKLVVVSKAFPEDLVLGNRFPSLFQFRHIPDSLIASWYFTAGHIFFTLYFDAFFRRRLVDPATMWKLMNGNFARSLVLRGGSFNLDFELLAAHIKLSKDIREIPISYSPRNRRNGKKIRTLYDPMIWLFSIPKYALTPVKYFFRNAT